MGMGIECGRGRIQVQWRKEVNTLGEGVVQECFFFFFFCKKSYQEHV